MPDTYPGNAVLSAEVKSRVASTFRQTLQLYRQGNVQDTIAGCELILKMDALFDPAKKLLAKARNPAMELDLETLLPPDPAEERLEEARAALQNRDFQRAADICSIVLASDLTNQQAQAIASEAHEKLEADPFVRQFLDKCRSSLAARNLSAAKGALEKARSLDPGHPDVRECELEIERYASGGQPPPAPPTGGAGPQSNEVRTDSFVVDSPGTERSSAPATDFGFTFEEEPHGQREESPTEQPLFSADSFSDMGAEVGEAQTFDFTTASVETTPEDQLKINGFLEEGQRAFDAGDFATAIDVWSKVFLIDVTHEDASARIEEAKKNRREIERETEDLFIAGSYALDRQDYGTAREKFTRALELDPSNAAAREHLEKLPPDAGTAAPFDQPSSSYSFDADDSASTFDIPESASGAIDDFGIPFDQPLEPGPTPKVEPPPPVEEKAYEFEPPAPAPVQPPPAKRSNRLLVPVAAALGVILVLAAVAYFLIPRFFGSGQSQQPMVESSVLIQRAQTLSGEKQFDQAISLLVTIPPDDDLHDRALEMIADLKKKKADAAGMIDGRPSAEVFEEYLQNARTAFDAHDFVAAKENLQNASAIRTLPQDAKSMLDQSAEEVAKLASAINLYKEGNYARAIDALEPMLQQDPQNKNIRQILLNAHFNMGVNALRAERSQEARAQFDKVLEMDPDDEIARRSRGIADRYDGQPKDLLYQTYVKYLPIR